MTLLIAAGRGPAAAVITTQAATSSPHFIFFLFFPSRKHSLTRPSRVHFWGHTSVKVMQKSVTVLQLMCSTQCSYIQS